MEELIQALRVLLSDTVALKFKAHGYHWNVEGDDFPQYHEFFEEIYTDYDGAIDTFAEYIRKLGEYAPYKLSRFQAFSDVPETDVTSDPVSMSADLLMANDMVTVKLVDTFDMATALRQQALANFLAERQDMHQRWHWMLSAVIKPVTE
jgi:starvation-inducible DNA-binding protein